MANLDEIVKVSNLIQTECELKPFIPEVQTIEGTIKIENEDDLKELLGINEKQNYTHTFYGDVKHGQCKIDFINPRVRIGKNKDKVIMKSNQVNIIIDYKWYYRIWLKIRGWFQ